MAGAAKAWLSADLDGRPLLDGNGSVGTNLRVLRRPLSLDAPMNMGWPGARI